MLFNPAEMKRKKVFLGGTCNNSNWREALIADLTIDYFNPVVDDWTEEDYKRELKERETCDFCLYVITPKITGVYSIAEVIDDSNKRPERTVFAFITTDQDKIFSVDQIKSLNKVGEMVKRNGGTWCKSLSEVAQYLNTTTPKHKDMGEISDGYHTFDELYHHRAILFSVVCNNNSKIAWKSKQHDDGSMYDGMFIVGIDTPYGQATYHYDIDPYWDLFHVEELERAPKWDGHSPEEAIKRIALLGGNSME